MGLVDIVKVEFEKVLNQAERAYSKYGEYVLDLEPSKRRLILNEISNVAKKISIARSEVERLSEKSTLDFTLDNVESLKKAYNILERALPDNEGTHRISEAVLEGLNKQPLSKGYKVIRENLIGMSTLSGLSAYTSFEYLDNPIAGVIYSAGAIIGVTDLLLKKDSVIRTLAPNLSVFTGSVVLAFQDLFTNDLPNASLSQSLIHWSTWLANIPGYVSTQIILKYSGLNMIYNSKIKSIKEARGSMDEFMKSGIAIREAYKNLKYAQNITQNEGRPLNIYQDQISHLESTLVRYIQGDATYEQVLESKLKPIKRNNVINGTIQPSSVSVPKKTGLSPEEYAKLKQQDKGLEKSLNTQPAIQPQNLTNYEQTPSVNICFSLYLQSLYHTKEQVEGYTYGPLMDLTKEKIENNPKGTIIRENASGRPLLLKIRKKHNLSPDVPVYKMQPIGALRALYTRQNGTVNVLDIYTHAEYERLMKP